MTVYLNKWVGERFENDTRCDPCQDLGSVVVLPLDLGHDFPLVQLCGKCLDRLQKEISEATLKAAVECGKRE